MFNKPGLYVLRLLFRAVWLRVAALFRHTLDTSLVPPKCNSMELPHVHVCDACVQRDRISAATNTHVFSIHIFMVMLRHSLPMVKRPKRQRPPRLWLTSNSRVAFIKPGRELFFLARSHQQSKKPFTHTHTSSFARMPSIQPEQDNNGSVECRSAKQQTSLLVPVNYFNILG